MLVWFLLFAIFFQNFSFGEVEKNNRRSKKRRRDDPFHRPVGSKRFFTDYEYKNITMKMRETIGYECSYSIVGTNISINNNNPNIISLSASVELLPPTADEIKTWMMVPAPMVWFSPDICAVADKYFHQTIGCTKGVQLHPDCPRCHRERAEKICRLGQQNGGKIVIPEARHVRADPNLDSTTPFLIRAKNAFITACGGVSLNCGVIQTRTGCGAVRDEAASVLHKKCIFKSQDHDTSECSAFKKYSKVFVLSYKYDSAIGHFMTEILPRLAYYYKLLTNEEDPVYIHYGCDKKFGKFSPPLKYMEWLGIPMDRFIQGDIFADEVIVPRDGACQDLMYNRWEFIRMREMVFKRAGLTERLWWTVPKALGMQGELPLIMDAKKQIVNQDKPLMVVIQRSRSKFSARKGDITRIWGDEFYHQVVEGLRSSFPLYQVIEFSDQNYTLLSCLDCQFELFSRTSVLVGMHGAGLSNMMFMPVGGTVVEITPGLDGRMLPGTGPFSRLSMAAGVKHVIYNLHSGMQKFTKRGTSFDIIQFLNVVSKVLG